MTTQVVPPRSVRGQFRRPLHIALVGAVAALVFTGGMIVQQMREESASTSPVAVQQHNGSGESIRPATAAAPITLYLVGSEEAASRLLGNLEMFTDINGQPASTNGRVLALDSTADVTLTDARLHVVDLRPSRFGQPARGRVAERDVAWAPAAASAPVGGMAELYAEQRSAALAPFRACGVDVPPTPC